MIAATWSDTPKIIEVLGWAFVVNSPGGTLAKTILVADESKTIQRVVEMTFEKTGYDVVCASSAQEALQLVPAQTPVAIVSDVKLPDSDGYSLSTTIKQQATTQEIPVLLLTRTAEPIDETKAQLARVDGYIKKPFDSGDLIDLVKQVTGAPVETDLPKSFAATLSKRASEGVVIARAPEPEPVAAPSPFAPPIADTSALSADLPLTSADIEIEEDLVIEEVDIEDMDMSSSPPAGPTLEPPEPPTPASERAPVDMWALADGHEAAPAPVQEPEPEPIDLGAPYEEPVPVIEAPPVAVHDSATRDMNADEPTRDMSQVPQALAEAAAPKVAEVVAPAVPGLSRDELVAVAREVIEQIAWEVVPDLAETIIRQELSRLMDD